MHTCIDICLSMRILRAARCHRPRPAPGFSPFPLRESPSSVSASTTSVGPGAGPLQRLVAPLIDPSVFDFWAGLVNPAWSWSRSLARVVERRVEAQDAITLVLQPNRHCGKVRPGQHINVSAEVNGRRTTRS